MFFRINKGKVFILCLIVLVSTGAATLVQFIKGALLQNAIDKNLGNIQILSIAFVIIVFIEISFYYIEWKYENIMYSFFVRNTKKKISKKFISMNNSNEFEKEKERYTNILNNKIDRLEFQYYKSMFDNTYLFFKIILVSISLFYINLLIGFVTLFFLFIPLLITKLYKERLSNLEKNYQKSKGKNLKIYENYFSNLKTIKSFDLRDILNKKLDLSLDKEIDQYVNAQNLKIKANISNSLLSYSSHVVILIISVTLVSKGKLEGGMILTLLGLIDQLSMPILVFSRNMHNINSTKSIRGELSLLLDSNNNDELSYIAKREIITNSININTDSNSVIEYSDLKIDLDKHYLFKGPSGIGKSLFIDLLLKNITSYSGDFIIDGEITSKEGIIKNIGYIETSNTLIDESVEFNIFLDRNITQRDWDLAKKILPEDILKSRNITNLSSGEKRRVLLLRGLLSNKNTIIFDEPTSNLDSKNAKAFWDFLQNNDIYKKTYIVISHNTPQYVEPFFDQIIDFADIAEKKSI